MIIDWSGHHHHHHDRACHHDHYQDHLPLCCCHIIMILKNASFSKSFGLTTDQDYYTNVLSGVFPGRILALSCHLNYFDTFTLDEALMENGVWLHFSSIFKRDCAKTLLDWNSLSWTSPHMIEDGDIDDNDEQKCRSFRISNPCCSIMHWLFHVWPVGLASNHKNPHKYETHRRQIRKVFS